MLCFRNKSFGFYFIEKQKEHDGILSEGVDIKRELCRQRMSSDQKVEAVDRDIHEAMMAELILAQNQEAERLLQDFMSKVSWILLICACSFLARLSNH